MVSKVIIFIALFGVAAASMPVLIQPVHYAPQPYKFGYDIKDKHGEQYRQEEGTGGNAVKGSYGFTDARGVKRQVDYVADHAGFRAQVKTNEPGTANQNPAAVQMISNAPYANGVALGSFGNGGYGLGAVGTGYGNNLGYAVASPAVAAIGNGNLGYAVASPAVAVIGNGDLGYAAAAPVVANGLGYNGLVGNGIGVPSLGYARYGY